MYVEYSMISSSLLYGVIFNNRQGFEKKMNVWFVINFFFIKEYSFAVPIGEGNFVKTK